MVILTNNRTRKSRIFVTMTCAVLASVLVLGGSVFPAADASSPLYRQIQDGVENKHLECGNSDHRLVIRPSLQPACVTAESASRVGWPDVMFSDNGNMTVRYTQLEVEVDGKKFPINATLKNGLIEEVKGDSQLYRLSLKINSVGEGKAWLEIRDPLFLIPELSSTFPHRNDFLSTWVMIHEDLVHYQLWPDQSRLVVEFPFPDTALEIDILTIPPIG